jgi:hypothetical protein
MKLRIFLNHWLACFFITNLIGSLRQKKYSIQSLPAIDALVAEIVAHILSRWLSMYHEAHSQSVPHSS